MNPAWSALALLLSATTSSADQSFTNPTIDVGGRRYRLDRCLHWETLCECAAARAYCRLQGFKYLHRFTVDYGLGRRGVRTAIIADPGVFCPDHHPPHACDGFSEIVCSQNDAADGGKQCGKENWIPSAQWSAPAALTFEKARSGASPRPAKRGQPTDTAPVTPGGADTTDFGTQPPSQATDLPVLLPPPKALTPNSPDLPESPL